MRYLEKYLFLNIFIFYHYFILMFNSMVFYYIIDTLVFNVLMLKRRY